MLRERLKQILRDAAGLEAGAEVLLEASPKPDLGDYASNLPLALAKERGVSPMRQKFPMAWFPESLPPLRGF